jgi:lambda family phage tail tape measure protein
MARNRIEELLVELKFQGAEELKKIAGGFRELGRATSLTDTQIESARKQINDYAKSLNNSEQALKGQIQALQTLRTQATVGGNVYSQLANDVTRLSKTLKGLEEDYKAVGRAAEQTDRQIANQFPARRPEAFRVQMAALRRELDGISISARAYGDALTEITIRQTAFGRAQARQGVIAGAQAVGAPLISSMTPQQALPNTTAALRLQVNELQDDLQNLDRASEDYLNTARRISDLQEELSRNIIGTAASYDRLAAAENAAIRRGEKLRGIQEYYRTQGPTAPGVGGFRDPATGAMIAAGTRAGRQELPTERPMREISGLFQQIGQIGMQPIIGQIELMGKGYQEVAQDIRNATAASNGSIQSLQAQRGAWQSLASQLAPSTKAYREVSKELERVDRQLDRVQRRRRMGAMEATQAAGAVISGGIFGGPEGAIGGAVGTAVGGVPGAFAGAAIGAQVGMIRQSLGQMASFTAEIDKQRIALRNVVGTQAEYQSSLQFIDATSRRLAIPQDQLNKQFTQLSASVIGAGGNVDAAKMAFEGIAAGIRGTGGNLADMQSALLATSQVFSKGKVSAEELRQQIGERLPGAFTIFAESIGKTPQQLDKMLEKGEVTLNDFMTFVQALSERYGASANEIAASSQSAGDRMATTFARIREAVGRELQPVGAQFQEIFATLFTENEQAIISFAQNIAAIAKGIADNAGLIAESLKVLLGFGAIAAAIPLATGVAAAFTNVSLAIASMGGAASAAGLAVNGLSASLLAVPGFGWAAAGVVALGLLGKAVYDNNEIFKNWVDNIGGVVAGDFRNSMDAMAGDAESATNRISTAFEGLGQSMSSVSSFIQQVFDDLFGSVSQSGAASASQVDSSWANAMSNIGTNTSAAFNGLTQMLASWWEDLPAPLRNILGGNTASALAGAAQYAAGASRRASRGGAGRATVPLGPDVPQRLQTPAPPKLQFRFSGGDTEAGGGGKTRKGAKGPESRAAELRIELNLTDQLLEAESLISQAKLDNNEREAAILQTLVAQTRLASEAAKLELEKIPAQDKALRMKILEKQSVQESARLTFTLAELERKANDELKKSMEAVSKQVEEFKNRAAFEREYGELIMQGTLPATAQQYLETKRVVEETLRAAEAALAKAEADGASADEIERQRKELERIRGAGQEELGRIQGGDDPSSIISGAITRIKGEMNELLNLGNQVVGAATAIGNAFGNSFKGLVSGSMTAKEALRSFFQSTADYFLDMASKIIAKQIQMFILNTVLGFIGGGQKGLSDLSAPASINNPLGVLNANGNAFAQNGVVPYAKGGIVNRPTMFKFANGGQIQNGLMGEAGPEAIMPLKRGADGKLGVAANLDGAMSRYRRSPGTMTAAGDGIATEAGAAPDGGPITIDVRYSVERINDVEYVTAAQFQQGMQLAATQGAKQGEQSVLRKMQQSPSVRRRVGMS